MIKIKNKYLTAKIYENGAQIASLKDGDTELMWQKDENVWNNYGPVLFPICGGLKDDKYTHNGVTYELCKHGFARTTEFDVKLLSKSSVTLSLKSDEETRAVYPFDFELDVTFTLLKKQMLVEYAVKNTGNDTMYFSIGSHEGYICEGTIEDYDIIFPQKETLDSVILHGNLLSNETKPILKSSKQLPIYEEYFEHDSLVFKNLNSRSLVLRNRKNGRRIGLSFPGCDYFVIWHKVGAKYICLEPWTGIPDSEDFNGELCEKEGIIALRKGKKYRKTHKITVLPQY